MDQLPTSPVLEKKPVFSAVFPWILVVILIIGGGTVYYFQQKNIQNLEDQLDRYENLRPGVENDAVKSSKSILALSIQDIALNESFKLSTRPRINFSINKVSVSSGGINNTGAINCGQSNILAYKYLDSQEYYWCFDPDKVAGMKSAYLFTAEVTVDNQSSDPLSVAQSGVIKVFYEEKNSSGTEIREARSADSVSFSINSLSTASFRKGFIVPSDINSVYVVYGDFTDPKVTGPALYKNAQAGFKVDFSSKSYSKLSDVDVNNLLWQYKI